MENVLTGSVNQWCIALEGSPKGFPRSVTIGCYVCHYSLNTPVQKYEAADNVVCILGHCVDVEGVWGTEDIASRLCMAAFDDFLLMLDRICGVYVVFRSEGNRLYIFGDAIHMMPIYYGRCGAASCEAFLVDDPCNVTQEARSMVRGAFSPGLFLANDATMYEGVKCLLPNHYLDFSHLRSIRYFPRGEMSETKDAEEIDSIVEKTIRYVRNVILQFSKTMKFASPLTAGGDSRVNCAFLRKYMQQEDILYYVLRTQDIVVDSRNEEFVKSLANKMGIEDFHVYPILPCLSEEQIEALRLQFGPTRPWSKTIWTYHPDIGMNGNGRTIVNGQLIGHLLGSDVGRSMPKFFVSKKYILALQGNVSREARCEVSRWYDETLNNSPNWSMLDMWLWEIRCGRWNSNLVSINSLLGIRDINFYNARCIISEWCRVPRELRIRKLLHKKILERLMPEVSCVDFNPSFLAELPSEHLPSWVSPLVPRWSRVLLRYYFYMLKHWYSSVERN